MEKYLDLKKTDHFNLFLEFIFYLDETKIEKILDAGSRKTSLSILLEIFPKASVDAVVFPGDDRKINSIEENIISKRCVLMEMDICKETILKKYDLILAHLLLGEAEKWGNNYQDILTSLINIECEYILIFDILEDPSINYNYLEYFFKEEGFELVAKGEIPNKEPQLYENFVGENYVAYLFKRK